MFVGIISDTFIGNLKHFMSFSTIRSFCEVWVDLMFKVPKRLWFCFLSKMSCSSRTMYSLSITSNPWKHPSLFKNTLRHFRAFQRCFFSSCSISIWSFIEAGCKVWLLDCMFSLAMLTISLSFSYPIIYRVSTSNSMFLSFCRYVAIWVLFFFASFSCSAIWDSRLRISSCNWEMRFYYSRLACSLELNFAESAEFFFDWSIFSDVPSITPAISFSIISWCRNLQYSKRINLWVCKTSELSFIFRNLAISDLKSSRDLFSGSEVNRQSFKIFEGSIWPENP